MVCADQPPVPNRVLWTPHLKVNDEVTMSDFDLTETFIMTDERLLVKRRDLAENQGLYNKSHPDGVNRTRPRP